MPLTTELTYLALVTVLTGLLWVPYILNTIAVRGLVNTVGYPADPKTLAPWAARLKRAHANAVENLVVFAALVLAASIANLTNEATALACVVYFWARVAHAVVYALGIPWVRTLAFVVGFAAQVAIALRFL